jgi:predicted  nucleic acid-binding Zn-ribbon protein
MDILRNLQGEGQDDETQAISIRLALDEIEQRIKRVRGTDKDRSEFSTGVERELNTIKDGIIAEAVKLAEHVSARAAKRARLTSSCSETFRRIQRSQSEDKGSCERKPCSGAKYCRSNSLHR